MYISRADSREQRTPYNQQQGSKHPKDGKDSHPTADGTSSAATEDVIDISLTVINAEPPIPMTPARREEADDSTAPEPVHIDIKV